MLTRLQSLEARKSIVPIKVYDVDHTETRPGRSRARASLQADRGSLRTISIVLDIDEGIKSEDHPHCTVFQSLTDTVRQKTEIFFGSHGPLDDGGALGSCPRVLFLMRDCSCYRFLPSFEGPSLPTRPGQLETRRQCRRPRPPRCGDRAAAAAALEPFGERVARGVTSHSEFCPHWPHYLRAPCGCGQPQPRPRLVCILHS